MQNIATSINDCDNKKEDNIQGFLNTVTTVIPVTDANEDRKEDFELSF
jgi:hypothetical protein